MKSKLTTVILLIMLTILSWTSYFLHREIHELRAKVATINGIIIEEQAFIRNQRNVDQDIWDMLNLHSEQLSLIWERIP